MRINTFCLLAAVAVVHVVQAKNVAVIIGGYGGGNSVEVITDGKVGVATFLYKLINRFR
jgi:hypothetical protein